MAHVLQPDSGLAQWASVRGTVLPSFLFAAAVSLVAALIFFGGGPLLVAALVLVIFAHFFESQTTPFGDTEPRCISTPWDSWEWRSATTSTSPR